MGPELRHELREMHFGHFQKRLKERYGIHIERTFYEKLNFQISIRKARLLGWESQRRSHWLLKIGKDNVHVIHDCLTEALVTALPRNAKSSFLLTNRDTTKLDQRRIKPFRERPERVDDLYRDDPNADHKIAALRERHRVFSKSLMENYGLRISMREMFHIHERGMKHYEGEFLGRTEDHQRKWFINLRGTKVCVRCNAEMKLIDTIPLELATRVEFSSIATPKP